MRLGDLQSRLFIVSLRIEGLLRHLLLCFLVFCGRHFYQFLHWMLPSDVSAKQILLWEYVLVQLHVVLLMRSCSCFIVLNFNMADHTVLELDRGGSHSHRTFKRRVSRQHLIATSFLRPLSVESWRLKVQCSGGLAPWDHELVYLLVFAVHLLTGLVVSKEANHTRIGSWQIRLVPLRFHESSVTVGRWQGLLLLNMHLFNASIIVQKRLQGQILDLS